MRLASFNMFIGHLDILFCKLWSVFVYFLIFFFFFLTKEQLENVERFKCELLFVIPELEGKKLNRE